MCNKMENCIWLSRPQNVTMVVLTTSSVTVKKQDIAKKKEFLLNFIRKIYVCVVGCSMFNNNKAFNHQTFFYSSPNLRWILFHQLKQI